MTETPLPDMEDDEPDATEKDALPDAMQPEDEGEPWVPTPIPDFEVPYDDQ